MKGRLIDRAELSNRICDKWTKAEIMQVINDMPAADERRGLWIDTMPGDNIAWKWRYQCSLCRRNASAQTNFCPECGADMSAALNE